VSVKNGDVILFRVDVFNHCHNALWITEIEDILPPGLIFDPAATIAHIDPDQPAYNNSLWAEDTEWEGERVKIKYIGPPIYLEPWTGVMGRYPEHRLPLVLKVDIPEDVPNGTVLMNYAGITKIENTDGEDVTKLDPTPENNWDEAGVVPNNEIILSCEVDKDTIRRTSAAYVSPAGREGFDNVGDKETYRYDVNFRSTSNIAADEFVVDDPLEHINNGQVRLEMLVTPVVWGDVDGKYNLWYKTNMTNDNQVYVSDITATDEGVTQKWPNRGYKLWAAGLDTTKRQKLEVSKIEGLAEGEYITALRFEYGAVLVGFTSKNYSSVSLNGKHRDASGSLTLPQEDLKKIEGYTLKEAKPVVATPVVVATDTEKTEKEKEKKEGNIFKKLFPVLFGDKEDAAAESEDTTEGTVVLTAAASVPAVSGFSGVGAGDVVDWTPDPARPDFASGALNAEGLAPVSYLVSAAQAMEEERIVTSAKAQIAKGELWDEDIDAVVTLQLMTFMPDTAEGGGLRFFSTFEDEVPKLSPDTLPAGTIVKSARTFDDMKPVLWIVTAIAAAFCALLLLRLYNIKKRRTLLVETKRRNAR